MTWAPDYITGDELKAFVRIDDELDDAQIGMAITAASRAIDRATRRQFGRADQEVERFYTAKLDPVLNRMVVEIDDLMASSGLQVHTDPDGDETFPNLVTSYTLRPRNAPADGMPWTELVVGRGTSVSFPDTPDGVRVTGHFGWNQIPEAVKEACALQASRLLSRRDAPFGVAGSPAAGSEVRLLAKLDPDVDVVIAPYRRFRVVMA